MPLRAITDDDRAILREATLANMNWNGERISAEEFDASHELAKYGTEFDQARDFGVVDEDDQGRWRGVGWAMLLPADDAGYGFVAADVPEFSLCVTSGQRGRGLGGALLAAVVDEARRRGIGALSLSVEDGNDRARHLYERAGFRTVGRNGDADTMLLEVGPATPA